MSNSPKIIKRDKIIDTERGDDVNLSSDTPVSSIDTTTVPYLERAMLSMRGQETKAWKQLFGLLHSLHERTIRAEQRVEILERQMKIK